MHHSPLNENCIERKVPKDSYLYVRLLNLAAHLFNLASVLLDLNYYQLPNWASGMGKWQKERIKRIVFSGADDESS